MSTEHHMDEHWTFESLSDLDSEELFDLAMSVGIDPKGLTWGEVTRLVPGEPERLTPGSSVATGAPAALEWRLR